MYSMFVSPEMSVENRRKKVAEYVNLPEFNAQVITYATLIHIDTPVIYEMDEFPKMSSSISSSIKKYSECMINEVNRISPLLKGETLLNDFVSCLKEPFKEHLKGAAVLKRTTNFGVIYYFAEDYIVDHKTGLVKFTYTPPEPHNFILKSALPDAGSSIATGLLKKFAEGLAGKIGGFVGSELLKFIFPGNQGFDYDQLLKDLERIVKNANTDQTVAEQNGTINGIISYLNFYYSNRKKSLAEKKELYEYLLSQQSPLNRSLGILQEPDFKEKGLASFISGAQVDFTIYQELALQDYTITDPLKSSNIEALKSQVQNYIDFANGVIKQLINGRIKKRGDSIKKPYVDPFSGGEDPKNYWYYYDNTTKNRVGPWIDYKDSHAEEKCRESYNAYKIKVETEERIQATSDCKLWSDIIALWPTLVDNPLG